MAALMAASQVIGLIAILVRIVFAPFDRFDLELAKENASRIQHAFIPHSPFGIPHS
jgi:hypothetical protein